MTSDCAAPRKQTMEFQAEVRQLLNIVVNSLYTHKEIFLRELIANASDALEKLRILALTDPTVLEDSPDLSIWIETDPASNTLTISDSGIGMTYDEVVENIGTIASSGSSRFMEHLRADKTLDANLDLIGQFGVGFYSAFMVAGKVTLITRPPNQTMGVKWESTGDGTYQIEEIEVAERGTRVTLHLLEGDQNSESHEESFLDQYTIQRHIQRHCNFIPYPVRMNFVNDEPPRDETGEVGDASRETVITERVLNSIQPIWAKNPKDVSREQYLQFYSQQFRDWNEGVEIVHCKGEGVVEFTGLLFIPAHAPYGLYTGDHLKGLQLYCKHVLVINDCRELLPDYLKFVRGVVDSSELSLNVSREMLQQDQQLRLIRNHLERKVLETFKSLLENRREKYEALWSEYGKAIKGGIFTDYKNTEKLQDLLMFESSRKEGVTTLREYVDRMPDNQRAIFYVNGDSRSFVERLPQMEIVREKGIEVLYFLDKVDEFLTQHLREYDGKKLQSVSRGDLDLWSAQPGTEAEASPDDQYSELLAFMKNTLADRVRNVRISKRLKSSPVCLVSGDTGYSISMERLMRDANQPMFKAAKVLEVNPEHGVIKTMDRILKEGDADGKLQGCCQLLYDQALLIENDKLEDPIRFGDQLCKLIVAAYAQ